MSPSARPIRANFFPGKLAAAGIGHYVPPHPPGADAGLKLGDEGAEVWDLERKLVAYGYGLEVTGVYDDKTEKVVTAFQRHFRPARIDGNADLSTRKTLDDLLVSS